MKFIMKKKAFKSEDKYTIFNEEQKEVYVCSTENSSLAKQVHIKNENEQEVGFVSQRSNLLLPEFDITIGEEQYYMKREYLPVNPVYIFNHGEYEIEGTIGMHKYIIKNRKGDVVGNFTKKWLKLNNSYDIELNGNIDQLMVFTMVLAVDSVLTYEVFTII